MARVWLGPAGIPKYVRRARDTVEGIRAVKELGLNAMEVEFVQGVRMGAEAASRAGEVARELGVKLSVHAPYFINLCSEEAEKVEASMKRLWDSIDRAHRMGAWIVVVHAAYYGGLGPDRCYEAVKERLGELADKMSEEGIDDVVIGVEITARNNQFGSVEEAFGLAKELKRVKPVVDWGHLFARNGGAVDYGGVLDLWRTTFGDEHMHTHFTSVKYRNGRYVDEHEPISANMPPFEPLAEELGKRDMAITLICESPLLDQDAVLMKEILEKHGVELAR
ncbi:MAG: deoxyribonuclease IV [Thermoproteus sp.]|nr:deoxyribonuclease IV [Thermoproteus sp.]MDT7881307.1 deoxyribonuclease IV [Thermoproteus sp.]